MRPRCSQGRRSWILHRASMGHRTIGGPPKHCRNGFRSNHGDSCLYKTCIIWQSRSFKNIAGCRFTDIQNFQDLSLGVQRQKKTCFQNSGSRKFEISQQRFIKDGSFQTSFQSAFHQPTPQIKYLGLKFADVTQTTWIIPRHQFDDVFIFHATCPQDWDDSHGWSRGPKEVVQDMLLPHEVNNHILENWRNGKDDWTNRA